VAHATRKGILVVNTPGRNANSVADFTIGMMLAEARNIARGHLLMKNGKWVRQYPNSFYIPDMYGKTVGLIGFGEIGRAVARRLAGFDVRILVYDPFVKQMPEDIAACSLPELMRESDFVSVHVRSTKETEHLVNAQMIALMKPTAYLVNTARPAVIDENALYEALRDKRIAGAAIDVFNVEPPGRDYPLIRLENITVTPHMAGGSRDAFYGSPGKLATDLAALLSGVLPPHTVNPEAAAHNRFLKGRA
jgi:D-3-phosphoglycerate dehydrogenase